MLLFKYSRLFFDNFNVPPYITKLLFLLTCDIAPSPTNYATVCSSEYIIISGRVFQWCERRENHFRSYKCKLFSMAAKVCVFTLIDNCSRNVFGNRRKNTANGSLRKKHNIIVITNVS